MPNTADESASLRGWIRPFVPAPIRTRLLRALGTLRRWRIDLGGPLSPGNLWIEPFRLRRLAEREDNFEPTTTLFDSRHLDALAGTIARIRLSDPYLRHRLTEVGGLRAWEYGMLLRALDETQDAHLLDVGSGSSTLPVYLARGGARVTALDLLDPYSLPLARIARRFRKRGVELVAGSMLDLPFREASFDAVICVSAIEHLHHGKGRSGVRPTEVFERDTLRALEEMARILKPGGLFYLTSEVYLEERPRGDGWWGSLHEGRVVGAYPFRRLESLFLETLRRNGLELSGPVGLSQERLEASPQCANYRDRYISTFCLVAHKGK